MMRTSGTAIARTGAKRLIHDLADGGRATAALRAAAETAINLARRAGGHLAGMTRFTHIVVGQDVTGTNNHSITDAYCGKSITVTGSRLR